MELCNRAIGVGASFRRRWRDGRESVGCDLDGETVEGVESHEPVPSAASLEEVSGLESRV